MDPEYYKDLKELKWSLTEFVDDKSDFKADNEWEDGTYNVSIKKAIYDAVFGKTPTFARIDPFQEYFERCACLRDAMPITAYEGESPELRLYVKYDGVRDETTKDNYSDMGSAHDRFKRTETRVVNPYKDGLYLEFPEMYAELHDPDGTRRKFIRMAILMMYVFDDKRRVYDRGTTRLPALEFVYQTILDDVRPPVGKSTNYELIKSLMNRMSDDVYVELLYASHDDKEISEMMSEVKKWNDTRKGNGKRINERWSGLVPRVKVKGNNAEGNWSVIGEAFLRAASKLRRFDYVGPTPIPPTYGDAKFMANIGESEPSYVFYGETLQRFVYRSNGSFGAVRDSIEPEWLEKNPEIKSVLDMYKKNLKIFKYAILSVAQLFYNIRVTAYISTDLSRVYIPRDKYEEKAIDIMEFAFVPVDMDEIEKVVENENELNIKWWIPLIDAVTLMLAEKHTTEMLDAYNLFLDTMDLNLNDMTKEERKKIGKAAHKVSWVFINRMTADFRDIFKEVVRVKSATPDPSKSLIESS